MNFGHGQQELMELGLDLKIQFQQYKEILKLDINRLGI